MYIGETVRGYGRSGMDDFTDLDSWFSDTAKRVGGAIKRTASKAVEFHKRAAGDVAKKVVSVSKRVIDFHRRMEKKLREATKGVLQKYGSYIALAAQILNFIPGLGVAVGLAISAAAAAVTVAKTTIDIKAAKKAASKAEDKAVAQMKAESAQKATVALDKAYVSGQDYFMKKYDMMPERWQKMTSPEKATFFKGTIYDEHAKALTDLEVTREDFLNLSDEDQDRTIAAIPAVWKQAAAEAGVAVEDEGEEVASFKLPTWGWIVLGGAVATGSVIAIYLARRKVRNNGGEASEFA